LTRDPPTSGLIDARSARKDQVAIGRATPILALQTLLLLFSIDLCESLLPNLNGRLWAEYPGPDIGEGKGR
jgi:hypothetical protein